MLIQQLNKQQILGMRSLSALLPYFLRQIDDLIATIWSSHHPSDPYIRASAFYPKSQESASCQKRIGKKSHFISLTKKC